jgi:septal ring factor EnvC (AmiA/AmiB activator)
MHTRALERGPGIPAAVPRFTFAAMSRIRRFPFRALALLALVLAGSLRAQTPGDKDALRQQYQSLQEEIRQTEEVLAETKKNKQATVGELEALQRRIDIRRRLIANIADQIDGLDGRILENSRVIISLERDLDELRGEYAEMIVNAYIHQDPTDRVAFVLGSGGFAEALQRVQYLREYAAFRKEQIQLIEDTREALSFKVSELESAKLEKRGLLQEEERQRTTLNREREQQNQRIRTLSNIESKLLAAINAKKADAEELNRRIEQLIADEIRKERLRALEAANRAGENTGSRGDAVPTLTPEARLLSNQFSENRGRLPWPVQRGTITGGFGRRVHPVLRDPPVYIQSNGVDIKTVAGSPVRAVFSGEVLNIIYNPSFQRGVIVKHGEYFTVYTKLSSVSVKPGDAVVAGQPLGTVHTDETEDRTEVHLEVWKGTTLLNPEEWLGKP